MTQMKLKFLAEFKIVFLFIVGGVASESGCVAVDQMQVFLGGARKSATVFSCYFTKKKEKKKQA